ncbi:hypothetical protein ACHQM5_016249 [Ranunculus cassubicifolius]
MENTVMNAEAEHWLEAAKNLLQSRDLLGSKRFITRALQSSPKLDGIDQITAIIDVLLASEKRINNHLDWYSILQIEGRSKDLEFIKRQYKQLVLLLHPDKNKFPNSANAFKLVCDAWNFLSDPNKKCLYDNEFNLFLKFDPIVLSNQSNARRSGRDKKKTAKAVAVEMCMEEEEEGETPSRLSTFWTVCPYCYHLYEYPRVYEDCCLRCQNCRRGFHGVVIESPPPAVGPGKDLYYCCWAFFPIGFTTPENLGKDSSWKPFDSMVSENVEMGKRRDVDRDDDLGNVRGEKKGKSEGFDDIVMKDMSFRAERANEGNGIKIQGGNMGNKVVKDGFRAKNEEPPKTVRIKTTARKAVKPKSNTQKSSETQSKIDPSLVGMDLNRENGSVVEEPKKKSVAEGTCFGSIGKEEIEGIGFFEGLDDILGNLTMLQVPAEQKIQADS